MCGWGLEKLTQKLASTLGRCRTKRYNQAKDQEKEGFITCSK